jgi:hypothetical protein
MALAKALPATFKAMTTKFLDFL